MAQPECFTCVPLIPICFAFLFRYTFLYKTVMEPILRDPNGATAKRGPVPSLYTLACRAYQPKEADGYKFRFDWMMLYNVIPGSECDIVVFVSYAPEDERDLMDPFWVRVCYVSPSFIQGNGTGRVIFMMEERTPHDSKNVTATSYKVVRREESEDPLQWFNPDVDLSFPREIYQAALAATPPGVKIEEQFHWSQSCGFVCMMPQANIDFLEAWRNTHRGQDQG